jgi:hypothetical protein
MTQQISNKNNNTHSIGFQQIPIGMPKIPILRKPKLRIPIFNKHPKFKIPNDIPHIAQLQIPIAAPSHATLKHPQARARRGIPITILHIPQAIPNPSATIAILHIPQAIANPGTSTVKPNPILHIPQAIPNPKIPIPILKHPHPAIAINGIVKLQQNKWRIGIRERQSNIHPIIHPIIHPGIHPTPQNRHPISPPIVPQTIPNVNVRAKIIMIKMRLIGRQRIHKHRAISIRIKLQHRGGGTTVNVNKNVKKAGIIDKQHIIGKKTIQFIAKHIQEPIATTGSNIRLAQKKHGRQGKARIAKAN